jgi:LysR family transcriptional regulator, low CO2-responsive transcriptional regulator
MTVPDLHKIHIFHIVARMNSFTRAAEHLHMTQPTVSQQIALLEQMLSVKLFDRDTRSLRLTPAGKVLFEYAEKLLALADETVDAVQTAAGRADQTLKLGVGHTLATYLLPDVLSHYRRQHPAYRIRLSVGNTSELLDALAAAEIDLALVGSPAEHPDIVTEPFMRDRLVVIMATNDEWADREFATLDDLRERVFLTREPGSALYRTVARLMGEDTLSGESVILLGETEAIKRSVELGLGVALIQHVAILREVEMEILKAIPLREADDSRTYLIAQRKRSTLTDAATQFVQLLRNPAAWWVSYPDEG